MSAPRLVPLSEPTPGAREILGSLVDDGWPFNYLAVVAHNEPLLKRFVQMGTTLLHRGRLPARERELAVLRLAWRCRCLYEFAHHTVAGRDAGLSDGEVAALSRPALDGWGDDDRALVAMVDELHADDRVGDATWAVLRRRWSEAELVEWLMLVGFYRLVAGLLNSVDVPLEPGLPGWPA